MRSTVPHTSCSDCGQVHERCTGHRKGVRPLAPCQGWPVKGHRVCRMHGANSLRGAAHPNWKHGRRSELLAKASRGLAEAFEAALEDPDLESLRKEIAVCEARWQQLVGRLTPNGAQSWSAAAAMFEVLQFAVAEGAQESIKEALKKLGEVIAGGVADQAVWGELYGVMEQRRKLADTEGKNRERLHRAMTEEQTMALFAAIVALINQHVRSGAARQKISNGLKLIAQGDAGAQRRAAIQDS